MEELNSFIADSGEMELSFAIPLSQKVILGIVGLKFFDVVNDQTYTLKECGAIGVVGCLRKN